MGRIVAPYGVLGWLKILPETELLDGLLDYDIWWLGNDNDWRELTVLDAKIHNDVLVAKLQGIEGRDAALACKAQQIAVPRASLPKLKSKNEYYWSDLIGLTVSNKQADNFGQITDVFATGANDVIAVKVKQLNAKNEVVIIERLIPFTAQTILDVSLDAKTMLVDWDADF